MLYPKPERQAGEAATHAKPLKKQPAYEDLGKTSLETWEPN